MRLYSKKEKEYIKRNIFILNKLQLKKICSKLNIDYNIYIQVSDTSIKKINDTLHKEFIINKILCVLDGKKDKIIVYPLHI